MPAKLQTLCSRVEVEQLKAKLKLHELHVVQQNLQAVSYRTRATSHARISDSHWLISQRYKLKLETDPEGALHLHYELKVRYHLLQAEQHREHFTHYRWLAIEYEKKAEAHEMLCDYLQHKVAKRQPVEE
ncbi:hypothetical protein [Egbenema bharatensis]|uniref:hypothetical protein n=1 Tax=Egbenema bharatensis TaxID=3463334 RepID=UPI003A86B5BF